jgi:hypothetical protein
MHFFWFYLGIDLCCTVMGMSDKDGIYGWSNWECVCAWLPVCHTCSPTRGVVACCGWRARGQACIFLSIILSVLILSQPYFSCVYVSHAQCDSVLSFCLFLQVPIEQGLICTAGFVSSFPILSSCYLITSRLLQKISEVIHLCVFLFLVFITWLIPVHALVDISAALPEFFGNNHSEESWIPGFLFE